MVQLELHFKNLQSFVCVDLHIWKSFNLTKKNSGKFWKNFFFGKFKSTYLLSRIDLTVFSFKPFIATMVICVLLFNKFKHWQVLSRNLFFLNFSLINCRLCLIFDLLRGLPFIFRDQRTKTNINHRKSLYYFSKYSPLSSIHFCMRFNQLSKHFCHSD